MNGRLLSVFHSKFDVVPGILADWTRSIGGISGKCVLDFGCGEGASALGVALKHKPARIVGVDINQEHNQLADLAQANGINDLPDNLDFEEIKRGEISSVDCFDLIYSWSVFEHIDQALFDDVVIGLRNKLRKGGHLFVQISPLYYSPEGSHLWDIGFRRWEHLTRQIDHIHRQLYCTLAKSHADNLWSAFTTLNKITAPKLVRDLCKQGFRLLREYRTSTTLVPSDDLLTAHSRDALTTEQVVALFEKD